MSTIISFEFDPDLIVTIPTSDKKLFFPQSHNLTHISITFHQFHHCIRLLNQIGAQLQSFVVSIIHVHLSKELDLSEISMVSNYLFIF